MNNLELCLNRNPVVNEIMLPIKLTITLEELPGRKYEMQAIYYLSDYSRKLSKLWRFLNLFFREGAPKFLGRRTSPELWGFV